MSSESREALVARVTSEVLTALRQIAEGQGRELEAVLEDALRDYVNRHHHVTAAVSAHVIQLDQHRSGLAKQASFQRYLGIDYSGAASPDTSLKGLRVYQANRTGEPEEISPPPSPRKYWTRRGLAEWLAEYLAEAPPTLVGIDHSFSFPLRYFEVHHLAPDWHSFLDDFHQHWPTDEPYTDVDAVRDGSCGDGDARSGSTRWRRICEERTGAKSVFHFDVPGSVAKSTHAGLPWLRYLRDQLAGKIHFWPFDGWDIPAGKSALVEVYPSLWSKQYQRTQRTPDQHDAYSVARWLRDADCSGQLGHYLNPGLVGMTAHVAQVEGWILGVE